jgi:methyltransferase (TIGR00027 family)
MYVALYRALETAERSRTPLFRDPLAVRFLSVGLQLAACAAHHPWIHRAVTRYADRRAPGARTSAIARTRFIDDAARAAVVDGVRQVVLLGAGYDCRAHRLPELRECRVFEVDREATQAFKRSRVPPDAPNVSYVGVDFLRDDTFERLRAAGWKGNARTLFVWEGVTNYLTREAVERVLSRIGATAPGSTIVFTYVHRGLLDGSVAFEGGERISANVRGMGEPWTFGLLPDELAPLLRSHGLTLREDAGADDYRARHLGDAGRGYRFYRIACAQVAPV